MKINKQHILGVIVPILLTGYAISLDYQSFDITSFALQKQQLKEILLVLALGLFIWGFIKCLWFRRKSLVQKLRYMGVLMLLILLTFLGLGYLTEHYTPIDMDRNVVTPQSSLFPAQIALIFIILIFCVWILIILRDLIYIQQSKKTDRNFKFLLIFFFLHLIFVMLTGSNQDVTQMDWDLDRGPEVMTNGFYILFLLFALINGFRCKWIHYLNKKQKIGFFFYFVLAHVVAAPLLIKSTAPINSYSMTIALFFDGIILFYVIYMSMSLLGILFLLPSAGLMDRRLQEIHTLQSLSNTIGSVIDQNELVSKTTELAQKIVNADFSWMELKEGKIYKVRSSNGVRIQEIETIPETARQLIRKEVLREKECLLINDLWKNKLVEDTKHWEIKTGSILASPIGYQNKELGILYAAQKESFGFVDESRGLFQAFSDQVGVALENSNLIQVTIEQEVYREELRMAHESQMRLLPQKMPNIPGMDLNAVCTTANEIGGDFYDVIQIGEKRVDFVIGDVSGKGANAAFYMAELKGVIQAVAHHYNSAKQIILEVNTFIRNHFDPNTFATMAYGIFFPKTRKIQVVRAGHPPPGIIGKRSVNWIETKGVGLGLMSTDHLNDMIEEKTVTIKKGESLVFVTDGLLEAMNRQGEEYGEDRLLEILEQMGEENAEEMIQVIQKSLDEFTQDVPRHDDVTVVVLKVEKS